MVTISAATQAFLDALSGLDASGGDTRSDQADLEALKSTLLTKARDLDDAELKRVTLAGSEFGGSDLGRLLGDHHGRARRVVVETILGVVADLERYHEGVEQAERLLDSADVGTADTMERTRVRVEAEVATIIQGATATSEGDTAYHEARNSEANQSRMDDGPADSVQPEDEPGGSGTPGPTMGDS